MTFLPKHNFLTTVQSLEENGIHGNGNTSGSLDNDINKRLSGDGEEDNYNHMIERHASSGSFAGIHCNTLDIVLVYSYCRINVKLLLSKHWTLLVNK